MKQPGVPEFIINQDIGIRDRDDHPIVIAVASRDVYDHAPITLEYHHHIQNGDAVHGIPKSHISRIASQAQVIHGVDKIPIQERPGIGVIGNIDIVVIQAYEIIGGLYRQGRCGCPG